MSTLLFSQDVFAEGEGEPAKGTNGSFVMGTEVLEIPEIPLPKKGESIQDPTFKTRITRITAPADGWGKAMRRHIYSTASPFNCDGSRIALQEKFWHLYDGKTHKYLSALEGPKGDPGAPYWDPRDPNLFYFAKETGHYRFDIKANKATLVHDFKKDFPEMQWLLNTGYGEPSADGRYWYYSIMPKKKDQRGKQTAKIVYDMKQDRIVGRLPASQYGKSAGRYLSITPSGKRVVAGIEVVYRKNKKGKKIKHKTKSSFKLDFTKPVELSSQGGHSDIAIDATGREVMVFINKDNDTISMQDLETGKITRLLSYIHGTTWKEFYTLSGASGLHVSGNCYGTPGWAVVSTFGCKKEKTAWNSHVIYLVKLDPKADWKKPVIWRVAHTHAVHAADGGRQYWSEAHASIDRYGKSIVFASNWGNPKGFIEAYRCDLPEGWYEKLMGKEEAERLRAKTAGLLGLTVEELVGQ